mgnify:CR=1 FL=1
MGRQVLQEAQETLARRAPPALLGVPETLALRVTLVDLPDLLGRRVHLVRREPRGRLVPRALLALLARLARLAIPARLALKVQQAHWDLVARQP